MGAKARRPQSAVCSEHFSLFSKQFTDYSLELHGPPELEGPSSLSGSQVGPQVGPQFGVNSPPVALRGEPKLARELGQFRRLPIDTDDDDDDDNCPHRLQPIQSKWPRS